MGLVKVDLNWQFSKGSNSFRPCPSVRSTKIQIDSVIIGIEYER